jgi:8-oxo-dGTP pyrophosphatase MutT (NUDIX family)
MLRWPKLLAAIECRGCQAVVDKQRWRATLQKGDDEQSAIEDNAVFDIEPERSVHVYRVGADGKSVGARQYSYRPRADMSLAHTHRGAAAVLLLYANKSISTPIDFPHILLIERTEHGRFGGQIALPGGKVDRGESFGEAALRELDEEVGVRHVQVIGELPLSSTLAMPIPVRPFVAVPRRDDAVLDVERFVRAEPREVAQVLSVPVAHLLRSFRGAAETVHWMDRRTSLLHAFESPAFALPDTFESRNRPALAIGRPHIVWGLTARLLVHAFNHLESTCK